MGKNSNSILGNISGKLGNVVYVNRHGVSYVRSLPRPRKGKPSPAQQEQQARFGLLIRFLQPLKCFLTVGFKDKAKISSGMNLAFKYNFQNVITGSYPDFIIDPARVTLSRGSLPNVVAPAVSSTETGLIHFTWQNNSGIGRAQAGDKAMLVAYDMELGQALFDCASGPRYKEEGTLYAPLFSGRQLETYISFVAQNGMTADSFYTGPVTVL